MRDRYYLSCLFFGFVFSVSAGICFLCSQQVDSLEPLFAKLPLWAVLAFAFLVGVGLRGVEITTFTLSKPDYIAVGATKANTSYVSAALAQALYLVTLGLVLKVVLLDAVAKSPIALPAMIPASLPPILVTYAPALAGAVLGVLWGWGRRADERGAWVVVVALAYGIVGAIIGLIVWVAVWEVVSAYVLAKDQPSPFTFEVTVATLLGFGAIGAALNIFGRFGLQRRQRAALRACSML